MKFEQSQFTAFLNANSSLLRQHFSLDTEDPQAREAFISGCQRTLQFHDNESENVKQAIVYKLFRRTSPLNFPYSSFKLNNQVYLLATNPYKPSKASAGAANNNPPLPQHYVGKGTFGVVKLVIPLKWDNQASSYSLYTVKITKHKISNFLSETHFLNQMDQLIDAGARECQPGATRKFYTIMPYFPGGNLYTKLARHDNGEEVIPLKQLLRFLLQAALSIRDLHFKRIAHIDIKPQNMMLDQDGNVVLIDFGYAESIDHPSFKLHGTEHYMPLVRNGSGIICSDDSAKAFKMSIFSPKNRDLYAFFIMFHDIYHKLNGDEQNQLMSYISPTISICFMRNLKAVLPNWTELHRRMMNINTLGSLDELIARLILFDVEIPMSTSMKETALSPVLVCAIIKHYLADKNGHWKAGARLIFQERLANQDYTQDYIDIAPTCPDVIFSSLIRTHQLNDVSWLKLLQTNPSFFIKHFIGRIDLDYRALSRSITFLGENFPRWINTEIIEQDYCRCLPHLFFHRPDLLTSLPIPHDNESYIINLLTHQNLIPTVPESLMTPSLFLRVFKHPTLGRDYCRAMHDRLREFSLEKQADVLVHLLANLTPDPTYPWKDAKDFVCKSIVHLPQEAFGCHSFQHFVNPQNPLRSCFEKWFLLFPSEDSNSNYLKSLFYSKVIVSREGTPPAHYPSPLQLSKKEDLPRTVPRWGGP